ncbi:MAG: hypothetical protein ACK5Y2_09175 [Bdellovibrionales bacterium]
MKMVFQIGTIVALSLTAFAQGTAKKIQCTPRQAQLEAMNYLDWKKRNVKIDKALPCLMEAVDKAISEARAQGQKDIVSDELFIDYVALNLFDDYQKQSKIDANHQAQVADLKAEIFESGVQNDEIEKQLLEEEADLKRQNPLIQDE